MGNLLLGLLGIVSIGFSKGTPQEIRVGIAEDQSPHIYLVESSIAGPQGHMLDNSLKKAGFSPQYGLFPSQRIVTKFKKREIDATINVAEGGLGNGYRSSLSYDFTNCAFSLSSRKLNLKTPQDFKDLNIVAFKNASLSLKEEAGESIAKSFTEVQSVPTRIRMLQSGRADVLISEKLVFRHYLQLSGLGKIEDFKEACFFKPNRYWLTFAKRADAEKFDKSYKKAAQ